MPKYYVSSGELNVACESDIPKNAAIAVFERLKKEPVGQLGKITLVSERGFDSDAEDDTYFITGDLLDETNQLADFKSSEWL